MKKKSNDWKRRAGSRKGPRSRRNKAILATIATILLSGCRSLGTDDSSTRFVENIKTQANSNFVEAFDVNDVSFLFKKEFAGALTPMVSLQDLGVSEGIFNDIANRGKQFNITQMGNSKDWHVMSARFDPCAPGTHHKLRNNDNPCKVQIRFILQPLNKEDKNRARDFALHLVFDLGFLDSNNGIDTLAVPNKNAPKNSNKVNIFGNILGLTIKNNAIQRVFESLYKIKNAAGAGETAGAKLGVHPGLLGEDTADFEKTLKRELLAIKNEGQLAAFAVMGLEKNSPEPWIFYGGVFVPTASEPVIVQIPVPTLGNLSSVFNQTATTAKKNKIIREKGSIKLSFIPPVGIIPDPGGRSLTPLFNDNLGLNFSSNINRFHVLGIDKGSSDRRTMSELPFLVDNPEKTSFFMTDCVSCHSGGTRIAAREIKFDASLAVKGKSWYVTPKEVSGFIADDISTGLDRWNTRNFGYFNERASVSLRTLNETIDVTDFINRKLLAAPDRPVTGTALVCGDKTTPKGRENLASLWNCLYDASNDTMPDRPECYNSAECTKQQFTISTATKPVASVSPPLRSNTIAPPTSQISRPPAPASSAPTTNFLPDVCTAKSIASANKGKEHTSFIGGKSLLPGENRCLNKLFPGSKELIFTLGSGNSVVTLKRQFTKKWDVINSSRDLDRVIEFQISKKQKNFLFKSLETRVNVFHFSGKNGQAIEIKNCHREDDRGCTGRVR